MGGGVFHGFVWQNGSFTDTGMLVPRAISDAGEIAGSVGAANQWQAVVATVSGAANGHYQCLGTLGGTWSYPFAIDAAGVVVGQSETLGDQA